MIITMNVTNKEEELAKIEELYYHFYSCDWSDDEIYSYLKKKFEHPKFMNTEEVNQSLCKLCHIN
jgi:hypothetical protein